MNITILKHKLKLIFLLISLNITTNGSSQEDSKPNLPNIKQFKSIFEMRSDTLIGTSFLYIQNNFQYLITAKHLFRKKTKTEDIVTFKLNRNQKFEQFNGTVYFHPHNDIDIAVIKMDKPIEDVIEFDTDGAPFIAQDVYFLGFPLNKVLGTNFMGSKIPIIKKAVISGLEENNGINFLLLDGLNVNGFSGGPVIALDYTTKKYFIVGVITGYYPDNKDQNSGIIICNTTQYINQIINLIQD